MDLRAILVIAGFLALLGAFIGGYLKGGADTAARWEAATERLKADAATTLAAETAKAAAKDAENAELANRLDQAHAKAEADAYATATDFARKLREARRGASSRCPTAVAAVDPGVGAGVAPGGDGGLGQPDPGDRLRAKVKKLQAFSVTCNAWAKEVGR